MPLALPCPIQCEAQITASPCIYVLLDIGTKLIESSHPKAPYLSNGRSALHRGGLVGATQEILHLGVGRKRGPGRFKILAVQRGVCRLDDLHVLLRHPLLRETGDFESLIAIGID